MFMSKERQRWSAKKKQEVVLRLLRGRALRVLVERQTSQLRVLSKWRDDFLAGSRTALKSRIRHAKVVKLEMTGGQKRTYAPLLLWIKQRIRGISARTPTTVCSSCSHALCPGGFSERNAIGKVCDAWSAKITARKAAERSHVIALYQRDSR